MDPDNRLNEAEADRRLRDLFQQAGPLHAPEGLEERVLQALGPAPANAKVVVAPLLPRWTWPVMGILFAGLCLAALVGPPAAMHAPYSMPEWMPKLELPSLQRMLAHTTVRMGMLALIGFAALELYLVRRRGLRLGLR